MTKTVQLKNAETWEKVTPKKVWVDEDTRALTEEHARLAMEFTNNYNALTIDRYIELNNQINEIRSKLKSKLSFFGA